MKRLPNVSARTAECMCITALLPPPLPTLAVPEEGCGMAVLRRGGLLEPGTDLGRVLWVLAVNGAPLEDTLNGLGHVEPAAAERGVERHDAVLAEPDYHLGCLMAGKVVPDQEHAQRWQLGRQGKAFYQTVLPNLPCGAGCGRIGRCGGR